MIGLIASLTYGLHATANGLRKAVKTADKDDNNDVSTQLVAHDKNAIFSDAASYTFTVKNGTGDIQAGSVSYIVTTEKGVKVGEKKTQRQDQ